MKYKILQKEIVEYFQNTNIIDINQSCFADKILAINSLIPLLLNTNEKIKLQAIQTLGLLISELANENLEQARNFMRRFIWNLNDESGGIAWGMPEAFAEALLHNEKLFKEYGNIFLSYGDKEKGSFLENPILQNAVQLAIKKLQEKYNF